MTRIHVDLASPDTYARAVPHASFAILRREEPVSWQHSADPKLPGFWAITKYDDAKFISRNPEIFSSARGGVNLYEADEETLANLRRIMLYMDPPEHRRFRNLVNQFFTPRAISGLVPRVEAMAREIVDGVAERGECEFVNDVAAILPMAVICELMGVPECDRKLIFDLTNRMIGIDDPDFSTSEEDAFRANVEMFLYAQKLAESVQKHPGNNLATLLLSAEVDGHKLTPLDFNSFFLLLAVAGNETTRTVTTHGMRHLMEHPDQMRALQQDPALLDSAIEEMLRFEPPVLHFRRTAMRDVELRGAVIREGEPVVMWYPAINRDEDHFANPDRFDIRRHPNHHMAFGIGEHFCLGAHLARMELRIIFREILARLDDMQLAGPVKRLRSNFINGVKEMRVGFTPEVRRAAA
jgi:cholest-4-en-3-one 26-monooxygenase